MLYDYLVSLVRTYVPVAIGAVAAFLIAHGIAVDPANVAAVTAALTGAITGVYYGVVRLLELKFPFLGILLGHTAKPTYVRGSIVGDPHVKHGGPAGPPPGLR